MGIAGLLIGWFTLLVFLYVPLIAVSIEPSGVITFQQELVLITAFTWILFSGIQKLMMAFNKKVALMGYLSLILFFIFIALGRIAPAKNIHADMLHQVAGLALIWGWSTIDAVDLAMTRLLKKW